MLRKLSYLFLSFLITCQCLQASPLPEISSDGAVLIDVKTNTILYAKNMSLSFYPASTTKILTVLALLQDLDLDQVVTKTQEAVHNVPSDSSQIGLNVGDTYSVYDGLHAVLMASDNFVCYDLAKVDAGSIAKFAEKMNNFALLSGANAYNFVNPHGYHDINHYTSPLSLAKIGIAAFNNPILEEIAGTYQYSFTVNNTRRTIPLTHTAALLNPHSPYYNEHVVAAKTGFHDAAGRTLVAKAVYGDMELVGVVMRTDAPQQFEDINKLFNYASSNFMLTEDSHNTYSLINQTYSSWAQPYIQIALEKGWITNTSHNYTTPITQREFLNLLSSISPAKYATVLNKMIQYNGSSLHIENRVTTRETIANLIYNYFSTFNLWTLPHQIQAIDIDTLSSDSQKAINFCLDAQFLCLTDQHFRPYDPMSYEEAICLMTKLNDVIERYENYGL